MRRLLLIVSVLLAAALLAWAVWPRPEPAPEVVEAPPAHQFTPVEVRASGAQQGLTLTGTVLDPSGRPVPGAEVSLAASGQQSLTSVRCGGCNDPLLSCRAPETGRLVSGLLDAHQGELVAALRETTDGQGRFRFEQLAGTSFTVWAQAPGFGLGVKERAAPGDPVELFLPALRSIAGKLRDEQGEPVAGTVRVVSRRLAHVIEAQATPDGRFEVTGLGEGPFYVAATAPGKLPSVRNQVEAGPDVVTLTLQTPRRLEVRLLAQGKPVSGVVRLAGDHLTRELPAKDGLGVAETLYPGELVVSAVAGELSCTPQKVALDGLVTRVTLNLEKGGRISVTVLDEAEQPVPDPTVELLTGTEVVFKKKLKTGELGVFGPIGPGQYSLRGSAEGYQGATMPVALTGAEASVEVVLARGTLISGRVIDEYGRPAPGVSVLITPTGDTVVADPEGKFSAPVPSPGLYSLHAHHSDWGGGEVKVTAPKSGVELQLEPKAGAAVTVVADGRRVEGANVTLFHAEGNFRSDRPSGADGVVLMRGLPPGDYMLVATHPDFLPSERQPVHLEDGQLLKPTSELKAGAAVSGTVVDTLGAPVTGVAVNVQPRGAEPAVTDGQGQFSLKPLRPKGLYAVRIAQRGLDQVDRVIATAGGEPVKVVVKRQPVFHGRVLADGAPLKQFRVDEFEVNSTDGRFELPLPATEDRVIVNIEAPGYEPTIVDRPNSPDLGDFDLKRAPQITGRVLDEGGAPAVDAVVSCDSCEQSVLTNADGRFTMGRPPFQKEFTLVARKGRRTATRSVAVDSPTGVELVLKPGVRLFGSAWLADGKPAAGVEIAGLHVDRSEPVSVVTGMDGSYSLELAPGVYRFVLAVPGFQRLAVDPPAIIAEVAGPETRLDFGPAPGLGQVSVRLAPQEGYALWLVRGALQGVGNPPLELLRSSYAQLIYQPRVDRVTFFGLAPGAYTLVWSSFHAEAAGGPLLVPVSVPGTPEVTMVR